MGWLRRIAGRYLLAKGTAQAMPGQYKRPIVTLSKAIELDPQHAKTYINRGIAHLESGQVEKALEDLSQSLRLTPNALCCYNRALAWLEHGDEERALADLNEAICLDSQDMEPDNMRAIVLA